MIRQHFYEGFLKKINKKEKLMGLVILDCDVGIWE